ncbi:hypothetical protein JXA34_02990 [Patescibacteria group bacterium]|nr:hypothetical protein [Patescibacteria group bacterium]
MKFKKLPTLIVIISLLLVVSGLSYAVECECFEYNQWGCFDDGSCWVCHNDDCDGSGGNKDWSCVKSTWDLKVCSCEGSCTKPNKAPASSIDSGPAKIMSNSSVRLNSSSSDPDGDTLSCYWGDDSDKGGFSGADCTGAIYNSIGFGTRQISFSSSDGKKDTADLFEIDVYDCSNIVFPNADSSGTFRAAAGRTYELYSNIEGPTPPPSFKYEHTASCGSISGNSNPFFWTAPEGSACGKVCEIGTAVYLEDSGVTTTDLCLSVPVIINCPPSCGDFVVGDETAWWEPGDSRYKIDVNMCDGNIVLSINNADGMNVSSVGNMTYTWSVSCESCSDPSLGCNGSFPNGNVVLGSDPSVVWLPPVHSQPDNSELCDVRVDISDGYDTTVCVHERLINVIYDYMLEFYVNESDYGDCASDNGEARGVSITVQDADGGASRTIVDGSSDDSDGVENGHVGFDNIISSSNTFNVSTFYSPGTSLFRINCVEDEFIGGGVSTQINVTPISCGRVPVLVDLFKEQVSPWYTSIDGDVYSKEIDIQVVSSGQELGGGFYGSLMQFSDPGNGISDAFAHSYAENYTDTSACPSNADNCGYAENTGMISNWYNSRFSFSAPSHAYVRAISDISEVIAGGVHKMNSQDFNDDFNLGPVKYNLVNGDAVIYVEGNGSDLEVRDDIMRIPSTNSGCLFIVTDTNVHVYPNVGYTSYGSQDGYYLQADSNVEAGFLTSGEIRIENYPTPPDYPVLLTGPLVAKKILFTRDLGVENDMYPAESVKYNPSFIPNFTKMERDSDYCNVHLTGLRVFDLQFDTEGAF